MYVLDTNVISSLHKNYFRSRFVTLWKNLDALVEAKGVTSTREVFHELQNGSNGSDAEWARANQNLFVTPDAAEASFVSKIYAVTHFQANIEKQKLYQGGGNADSFVIARAYSIGGIVVTLERHKEHAVKIPNICDYFSIPYLDLEGFMEREGWVF